MAPPSWTTPEQKAMLTSWLPKFIERQAEGKLHLFWPPVMEAWFKEYPEHTKLNLPLPTDPDARPLSDDELATLGAAIKARRSVSGTLPSTPSVDAHTLTSKSKIGCGTTPRGSGGTIANGVMVSTATNSMVQRIFRLSVPKRQRAHQPIEVFQKRNKELIDDALTAAGYHELSTKGNDDDKGNKGETHKTKDDGAKDDDDDDEDDWVDESEDTPAARLKRTKSKRMRLRTRIVQGLWKEASAEERAAVEAEIEEEKNRLNEEQLRAEQEKTPEQRQQAIDALDGVFTELQKAVHAASGWVGMSICGGPNPRMNRELTLKIVSFGETSSGNDFEACCVDFDKNVIQPFQDYLRLCFSKQDSADWALPSTPAMSSDDRPVERVIAPPVASEKPVAAKKAKSKKSKGRTKSKKNVDKETELEVNNSDAEVLLDDSHISPLDDIDQRSVYDDPVVQESSDAFDAPPLSAATASFAPPAPSLWPPGMSSPLHPDAAARIACIERGGTANAATMAIDPQLLGLIASPPSSPTPVPIPRPAWKGAPRMLDDVNPAPRAPPAFFSFPNTAPPRLPPLFLPVPKTISPQTSARPTAAARTLLQILEDHSTLKTPTTPPVVPATGIPPAHPSSTPLLALPAPPVPATLPVSAPPVTPLTVAAPAVSDEQFVLPESRPPAKPLKPSIAKPAAKGKKTSSTKSAAKETAAAQAVLVAVKKPRGRPRKTPLDDITNVLADSPASTPTPETTVASTSATSTASTPNLVYTMTNNNRAAAKAAAVTEKRAREKEAEEVRAKEAARGWSERTVDGATVVTLTRTRKSAKFPDGSLVKAAVEKATSTRRGTKKQDPCEVLLARAQTASGSAAGKRKCGPEATSAPAKKRK
ncbi:hypothetical protein C8R45DRAFT_948206 [Mycena sanguinolenta]|nr:hypothetical protein C8R45DRAFT_948206 [Mycena sanguinolenta]